MDKKAFQEDILTLTEGKKERRSNTALIAVLMDDIEAALVNGVRRDVIYQALLKQGVTLTFQGFESALRELRKKRRAKTTQTRQPPQLTPPSFSQPKPESTFSPAPNTKPGPNLPGEKSALEKKQEAYKAFKKSLPDHLSIRERSKQLEAWKREYSQF